MKEFNSADGDLGLGRSAMKLQTTFDPALVAKDIAREAETEFLNVSNRSAIDEFRPEFVGAADRWEAADEAFADAVPTTMQGALAKLRALLELQIATPLDEDSLEMRHVRSLIAFFEGSHR